MTRGATGSRIVFLGNTLVLGLVVALPLCLALLPTETLQCELGTGELSAAALSSLDRDLQTQRVLPPHRVSVPPVAFLCLQAGLGEALATGVHDLPAAPEAPPPPPGSCTAGPTDAGHRLLL